MSLIHLQNTEILPVLEEDINIVWCKYGGKCTSLFQSLKTFYIWQSASTVGEKTSTSLHTIIRESPLMSHRSEHRVQSSWPISVLIYNSFPADSVSVLQQTFGCQRECLQVTLMNVELEEIWHLVAQDEVTCSSSRRDSQIMWHAKRLYFSMDQLYCTLEIIQTKR